MPLHAQFARSGVDTLVAAGKNVIALRNRAAPFTLRTPQPPIQKLGSPPLVGVKYKRDAPRGYSRPNVFAIQLKAPMVDRSTTPASTRPDDELVSPALRKRLQLLYDHAMKLAEQEKYDFDYANKLLTDCVVNDPSNLEYVEAFLHNLQRKYNNNKKGASFGGFGGRGGFKRALSKEDWREVLKQGPPLLGTNPWDVPTLRGMAKACEALRFDEVEIRYLKNALDANPRDPEVNKHCAQTLAGLGDYDQAIACWHRVEEARKGDPEAPNMISELSMEKQRFRSGIPLPPGAKQHRRPPVDRPGGPSSILHPAAQPAGRPVPSDEFDDPAEVEQEEETKREIKLTPRQVLERAIADVPSILENYFKLADLLCSEHKYQDAERTLTKALHVSGGDPNVREQLEEVQMRRARREVVLAERAAAKEKTRGTIDFVKEMRDALNHLELNIYTARAERYPQDVGVKFELAMRLKRTRNYPEALKLFNETRESHNQQAASLLEAGECLHHLKSYEKALKCYVKSAEAAVDDEDEKIALYRAGVLASGMKRYDEAARLLGKLGKLDGDYKDVRARLDKLEQIRHKE
jgi:tetratricopeptide (TPR) repeat protein